VTYTINREYFPTVWPEIEPLARQHYAEMQARFEADGLPPQGAFNPRLDLYFQAAEGGYLHCFVVRCDSEVVGHATVYLQNSMHNSEPYAREDTIFIRPDHRKGIGRRLVKVLLQHMKEQGAKSFVCQAGTDIRAGKLYKRLGFRPIAETMILNY